MRLTLWLRRARWRLRFARWKRLERWRRAHGWASAPGRAPAPAGGGADDPLAVCRRNGVSDDSFDGTF